MSRFTSEQLAVIGHSSGNALCLAGAGTGKTTTLVGLYQEKAGQIPAHAIRVLMFNADIRDDFKAKLLERGLQPEASVKTYHGFCRELLVDSGYTRDNRLRLVTEPFRRTELIRQVLKQLAQKHKGKPVATLIRKPKTVGVLESFIGMVKATMLREEEVFESEQYNGEYLFLLQAYKRFEALRIERRELYFDDWLTESVYLLRRNRELKQSLHASLKLLIVDEFQDTNAAQYHLLSLVKGTDTQIIAVGDIDQCIYRWRGSDPAIMLRFEKEFQPCSRYQLSQTFRFGHSLALAANHLISHNSERFKDFTTVSNEHVTDTSLTVKMTQSPAFDLIQKLKSQIDQGVALQSIAILFRRWSQTMLFELALLRARIPYQMPERSILLSSREIGLLLDLMRLVTRWQDLGIENRTELLQQLFSFPHCFLPPEPLKVLSRGLASEPVEQWQVVARRLSQMPKQQKFRFENALKRVRLLRQILTEQPQSAAEVFDGYRRDSDLDSWLVDSEATEGGVEETFDKLDAISAVVNGLKYDCFRTLDYFTQVRQQASHGKTRHGVQLTTIFRAKGCEYEQVHLPFWDMGTFPFEHKHASGVGAELEEERRLAYVALTRAKQGAHVYYGQSSSSGSGPAKSAKASRFINEAQVELACLFGPQLYQTGKLPACSSKPLESYLKQLDRLKDCTLLVKAERRSKCTNKKGRSRAAEPHVGQMVQHINGTMGEITEWRDPVFTIQFESGKQSRFMVAQFEQYFTVIE